MNYNTRLQESDIKGFENNDSHFSEAKANKMVFSEPEEDDEIDLPRFPDQENEDENNNAGEEARQHRCPVCFFYFKTTIGVIRGMTLKYLNFKKKYSRSCKKYTLSRILS